MSIIIIYDNLIIIEYNFRMYGLLEHESKFSMRNWNNWVLACVKIQFLKIKVNIIEEYK